MMMVITTLMMTMIVMTETLAMMNLMIDGD